MRKDIPFDLLHVSVLFDLELKWTMGSTSPGATSVSDNIVEAGVKKMYR